MAQKIPQAPPEDDRTRIVERPDGFYWQAQEGGREYGPFATLIEAELDMQADREGSPEPGETLREAESEIGISEHVDPDTGEPTEEQRPRLEDN